MRIQTSIITCLTVALIVTGPTDAEARRKPKAEAAQQPPALPIDLAALDAAIASGRLVQARTLLEQAQLASQTGPRLDLLKAEYDLARGQRDLALASFRMLTANADVMAAANQGAGIASIRSKRVDDALSYLTAATTADKSLWRAWNALGVVYDLRKNWSAAENAYAQALSIRPGAGEIFANRGYSRILQQRFGEAASDLRHAQTLLPGNSRVETNLRLALALSGDYENAIGVSAGDPDLARRLNNAGYAAWLRGDQLAAKAYLTRAMELNETYYDRAANNLAAVESSSRR